MQNTDMTRRRLLETAALGAAAIAAPPRVNATAKSSAGVPAALGGQPVRKAPFPRWPNFREADEKAVLPVLRSGVWSRSQVVEEAERRFARLMGAPYCVATCNGTNAIITSLRALGIGAGDEVITTPYTFVATHPSDPARQRAARLRRYRSGDVADRSRPRSKPASTRTRPQSCPSTSSAASATWTASTPSPGSTTSRS